MKIATVTKVIDSRTFETDGHNKKIQIVGFPESGTRGNFFEKKKKKLESLILGKRVKIFEQDKKQTEDTIYAEVHLVGSDEPIIRLLSYIDCE